MHSEANDKKRGASYVGLGIVFGSGLGAGLGVVFGEALFGNVGVGISLGAGLGIVFGAALGHRTKKSGDNK